jgi:hypothetical protein
MTEATKRRLRNESVAMICGAVAISALVWAAMTFL